MILSAQSIRTRCLQNQLVGPFHEQTKAHGLSFGLSACGYDIRIDERVSISAGCYALGSSMERFRMPLDLVGICHDKSTWARCGIAVQNTVLEPGWEGWLTLEISNHSRDEIIIEAGEPIAQIIFHLLDKPTEQQYGGKYQSSPRGPQKAIFEKY